MTKPTLLQQRRIEAGIIKPLVAALTEELGPEKTKHILAGVIQKLAEEHGLACRPAAADNPIDRLAEQIVTWNQGDALTIELLQHTPTAYHFNVRQCQFATMYRELGLADLGYTLSCQRDAAFINGFDPNITLTRTQTIMQGAEYCDFRYQLQPSSSPANESTA